MTRRDRWPPDRLSVSLAALIAASTGSSICGFSEVAGDYLVWSSTPLEALQPLVRPVPTNCVFQPHVVGRRELIRVVQARRRHVDEVGVPVVAVCKRRAVPAAEGSADFGRGAIPRGFAGDQRKGPRREGEPSDGLSSGRPVARDTVVDLPRSGRARYRVAHVAAKASTVTHLLPPHRRVFSRCREDSTV